MQRQLAAPPDFASAPAPVSVAVRLHYLDSFGGCKGQAAAR